MRHFFSQSRFLLPSTLSAAARVLFVILAMAVIVSNTFKLKEEIVTVREKRQKTPYIFWGFKFLGLDDILKNTRYIGYLTDKDLDKRSDAMQVSQAQYTLAPVILDFESVNHEYVLLDYTDAETGLAKVKSLGLVAMRRNQFGIILARNPKFHYPPR